MYNIIIIIMQLISSLSYKRMRIVKFRPLLKFEYFLKIKKLNTKKRTN